MSKLIYFDDDWINLDLHPSWIWLGKMEDKNKAMCISAERYFL